MFVLMSPRLSCPDLQDDFDVQPDPSALACSCQTVPAICSSSDGSEDSLHLHCSCDEDSEPDMPSAARRIAQIMATGTYMWQQRRRRLLDGPFFLFKIVWWQLAMA